MTIEPGQVVGFLIFVEPDARPRLRAVVQEDPETTTRIVGRTFSGDAPLQGWLQLVLVSWGLLRLEQELKENAITVPERSAGADPDDIAYRAIRALSDGQIDHAAGRLLPKYEIAAPDLVSLYALITQKPCGHRIAEPGGPFCAVSGPEDPTGVVRGDHRIAPTSGPQCIECDLPDSHSVCTHLVHPVVESLVGNLDTRKLLRARCERGRKEILSPNDCRPGRNKCWERLVDVETTAPAAIVPPRALAEALDQLDTTWRLTYQAPILRVRSAATIAKLLDPCGTKAEFESHLTAIGDTLKSLAIPDRLMPAQPKAVAADATFDRLQLCLLARPDVDTNRVTAAIGRLRAIVRIRNALQHYGSKQNIVDAAAMIGISYPPASWQAAWDKVRSHAVEALWDLSDELRRSVVAAP